MTISPVQIQQVLNDEDIEGLLQVGAPSDEYETEARMIAEAITQTHESKLTEERLTSVVKVHGLRCSVLFRKTNSNSEKPRFGESHAESWQSSGKLSRGSVRLGRTDGTDGDDRRGQTDGDRRDVFWKPGKPGTDGTFSDNL